jgi:ribosomal protein L12E/L44/L45/RPP1/RPP2
LAVAWRATAAVRPESDRATAAAGEREGEQEEEEEEVEEEEVPRG